MQIYYTGLHKEQGEKKRAQFKTCEHKIIVNFGIPPPIKYGFLPSHSV